MRRAKQIVVAVIVLAAVTAVLVWKNWHDRYVWPAPVAWMQDLPAEDRSQWPNPPVAWTTESVTVQVAMPDGLRRTNVTYHVNSLGMKFVRIEPGTFRMGLEEEAIRRLGYLNQLGHTVTLTKPYFLSVYETTIGQFQQFAPARQFRESPHYPAEPVTWQEAQRFCRWLSAREGHLYRLPTEAEWEYACKAGTTTRVYWGNDVWDRNLANVGGLKKETETWLEDGWRYSAPVGVYPPNPWGLHDMIGNSWEWVQDWYEPFTTNAVTDPQGPSNTGKFRVAKGGGWNVRTRHITASVRDGNNPADLHDTRGFRVLCEVE